MKRATKRLRSLLQFWDFNPSLLDVAIYVYHMQIEGIIF